MPFSLFEGDWLQRAYARLHLSKYARWRLLKRCALVIALTWLPVALLAWRGGYVGGGLTAVNFFADFAAYAQFLLAMPLFVLAEPIIDASTRAAARQFITCGIIRPEDRTRFYRLNAQIKRLRTAAWPDLACIAIGYALSLAILIPEFGPGPHLATWHVQNWPTVRTFSLPGAWEFLIALPLLNYTWLRYGWKILLWIYYLARLSRARLELHPTHADLTGGIGFISNAQSQFAIFILAYGISNIAATVGYEISILHYDLSTTPVWGPLAGFTIGAPLLFTLPLLMFTRQLYRSKQRALAIYRQRVTEHSRQVETRWTSARNSESAADEIRELTELSTLGTMFSRIENMRIVPFDLASFSQLIGSSLGSIATLLPILHVSGNVTGVFGAFSKFLGHFGAH
ncbi:MAG TPA: hypothetical protein VIY54_08355 [Steroidobacteraceae bacterium]